MSICAKCTSGDHSTHQRNLGGICVGCACPVGPDDVLDLVPCFPRGADSIRFAGMLVVDGVGYGCASDGHQLAAHIDAVPDQVGDFRIMSKVLSQDRAPVGAVNVLALRNWIRELIAAVPVCERCSGAGEVVCVCAGCADEHRNRCPLCVGRGHAGRAALPVSVLGMIVDARRLAPLIDGLRIVGETAIAKVVNGISMRGDGYIVVLAELAESARVTPAVFSVDAVR